MPSHRTRQAIVFGFLTLSVAGLTSCGWSVHQGVMVDTEDTVAEGRYEKAIRELDRAKRSDGLLDESFARGTGLESLCLEPLASEKPRG